MISDPGDAQPDSGAPDVDAEIEAALAATSAAALVLEVRSGRIVAASPAARQLVAPDGGSVLGHNWQEYTPGSPSGGLELFAQGRLSGFEVTRVLRQPHGDDLKVKVWVRSFEDHPPSRRALVVMVPEREEQRERSCSTEDVPAVVGTADSGLLIERISSEAQELFGWPVTELVGRSVIGLVAPDDVPSWLGALGEASANHHGVTLCLKTRPHDDDAAAAIEPVTCDALILPLHPSPSCAFAFLPVRDPRPPRAADDLSALLLRLHRTVEFAELARGAARGASERDVPGLSQLTSRELDIVTRLLRGDRVPVIAGELFLAQSTVRNHLAAVYTKLGVNSQQELISLFRAAL